MSIENKSKKFITDSPKINFFFGLVLGIAIISVVSFLLIGLNKNDNPSKVAGEEEEVQPVDLKIDSSDHVLGNPDAKVKIFEFSDFQCPYCSSFHLSMHQIIDEYGDKVAWVYKQFPIASHPLGMPGAIATECAAEQGKFWEMSDEIFDNQDTLAEDSFETFAEELGLDMDEYKICVEEERYKDKISDDYNLGIESGVRGTPSNFINGEMVPGAVPYENLKQMIDDLL